MSLKEEKFGLSRPARRASSPPARALCFWLFHAQAREAGEARVGGDQSRGRAGGARAGGRRQARRGARDDRAVRRGPLVRRARRLGAERRVSLSLSLHTFTKERCVCLSRFLLSSPRPKNTRTREKGPNDGSSRCCAVFFSRRRKRGISLSLSLSVRGAGTPIRRVFCHTATRTTLDAIFFEPSAGVAGNPSQESRERPLLPEREKQLGIRVPKRARASRSGGSPFSRSRRGSRHAATRPRPSSWCSRGSRRTRDRSA